MNLKPHQCMIALVLYPSSFVHGSKMTSCNRTEAMSCSGNASKTETCTEIQTYLEGVSSCIEDAHCDPSDVVKTFCKEVEFLLCSYCKNMANSVTQISIVAFTILTIALNF